jgi:myo-inositol 2-dehydrogenase/D-chiro-inositol 1-dehydrogenase
LISVGFMRRFDPQHVAVKQAVAAGQVGRPILFKGVHRNPMILPSVTGPIVVTNSAIHDLDSTRWLLGQEITEVFVCGVRTHESFNPDTLDMLLFQMTLTNGCLATIETSVAVEYGYEVLAEIVGERGSAITTSPADAVVRSNKTQAVSVFQSHLDRFQAAFVPEMIDWVRSVQTGQRFAGASAWDGYMATLVAQTCIQSLLSGAPTQVPTPEKPDLYV